MVLMKEGKSFEIVCNGKEIFGFCDESEKTVVLWEV